MLLIGAVSVLLPLTDELDKMFSDSASSGTVNKPGGSTNSGSSSGSENESNSGNENTPEDDNGAFSIDDFFGELEFFGDIYGTESDNYEEDAIILPIL